jgi:rSAM/selenodomain-associated transferase 1
MQHAMFQDCVRRYGIELTSQQGENLGDRMANAIQQGLHDYARVVLIGTDAPAVDHAAVTQALAMLYHKDVVIQPAEDGGYVLIAMRRFLPITFHGVDWGSSRVALMTRRNLVAMGVSWQELALSWDIDTAADLQRYRQFQKVMK